MARLLAERLGPALGETVIVENRPGQGGSLALASSPDAARRHELRARAARLDGGNPHLYKNVAYDSLTRLRAGRAVCDLPLVLVVHPSLPVKTLPELIAYAKANPDKLGHPSSGNGTLELTSAWRT